LNISGKVLQFGLTNYRAP